MKDQCGALAKSNYHDGDTIRFSLKVASIPSVPKTKRFSRVIFCFKIINFLKFKNIFSS